MRRTWRSAEPTRGRPDAYAAPVIVVIGSPIGWLRDEEVVPTGTPARAALAAAAAGRAVQLVGRTGDDPTADGLLLSLARGGVGHVALLRDPAHPTPLAPEPPSDDAEPASPDDVAVPAAAPEPPLTPALDAADVELGLRYLATFAVVVLAEPAGYEVVRVVADAARWSAAQLVMVVEAGSEGWDGLPADAIVFETPADDRDGVFAALLGRFAAALDDGTEPADAFRSSIAAEGWTEAVPD
jgi:sugar/nucleoside kinase (ribokinase family)